jgi:hypothetical protein
VVDYAVLLGHYDSICSLQVATGFDDALRVKNLERVFAQSSASIFLPFLFRG